MDLIKTIEEDAEIQNFSEDSDAEVEVSIAAIAEQISIEFSSACLTRAIFFPNRLKFSINRRSCAAKRRKNLAINSSSFRPYPNTITIHGTI